MVRKAKDLSALEVSRLTKPGHHAVGGVAGLYLYVNEASARSWVLRIMVGEKRRHMGLGGYPDVTLAQAREKARQARDEVGTGVDPIAKRKNLASELRAQQLRETTFKQAATAYVEAHGDSWSNSKHRAQWTSTLETYVYPVVGSLHVRDVSQEHVMKILEPIWKTKNETASRVRGRIESVLDWATVRGYRSGDNPARWKGHLDHLLPAASKVRKVEHRKALPFSEMPNFMPELRGQAGMAAKALEFAILTAARSGEVRGATWAEFDLDGKLWTVPASRMKANKEHRVPLPESAVLLLKSLPKLEESQVVFFAPRGGQLSDMALTQVVRRMGVDAVPHGFRSTFRDWAGEATDYPRELAEHALAHTLDNKVEAAYRRGDALERRRTMMNDWATFCSGERKQTMADLMRDARLKAMRA